MELFPFRKEHARPRSGSEKFRSNPRKPAAGAAFKGFDGRCAGPSGSLRRVAALALLQQSGNKPGTILLRNQQYFPINAPARRSPPAAPGAPGLLRRQQRPPAICWRGNIAVQNRATRQSVASRPHHRRRPATPVARVCARLFGRHGTLIAEQAFDAARQLVPAAVEILKIIYYESALL